jgi:hypothetical protein
MRLWITASYALLVAFLTLAPARLLPASAQQPGIESRSGSERAEVDLLLVLAADVSRSLDEPKFRLQRDGYAAALTNERVIRAIRSGLTGRIAVTFVEWSGVTEQIVIADWTLIAGAEDAAGLADRIRSAPRPFMGRTAIGSAIEFAMLQFPRSPWRAPRHLIDVSGDGTSNNGVDLNEARRMALAQGITINGLAILSEVPLAFNPLHTHPPGGLLNYYETSVIGGPNAFAVSAAGHEAFGTAILAKLIKEIAWVGGSGGIE